MLSISTALFLFSLACHQRVFAYLGARLFACGLAPARAIAVLCLCLFALQSFGAQASSAFAAQNPAGQQQTEKQRSTNKKPAASSQAKPRATTVKPAPKNTEKRPGKATPVASPSPKKVASPASNALKTQGAAAEKSTTTSPKAMQAVQRLQAEFTSLVNDTKRASLRHNWLNFETRINTVLERHPNQPEAMLLAAKTREELAVRARTDQDWREAAQRYNAFADQHSQHAKAAEARLKQATFLSYVQGSQDDAKRAIGLLQRDYPQSKQAVRAGTLLKELEAQAMRPPQGTPAKEGAQRGKRGKEARENKQDKTATLSEKSGRTAEKGKNLGGKATPVDKKATLAQQLGLTVRTIMLDPGHGGKDPGTTANSIQESLFAMEMAKKVAAALQAQGFTVILTRTKDSYISLQDRPLMANSQKADLFISLHANANPNPAIQGLETYYLDSAKSKDAALAAARENGIDVGGVSDLQFILSDLTGSSKRNESRKLATMVQKEILKRTASGKQSMVDNGVRSAPFYVLMGAKMPAILVEFGYVTNADDAKSLRSDKFLQLQAAGLADAVSAYKRAVEKY